MPNDRRARPRSVSRSAAQTALVVAASLTLATTAAAAPTAADKKAADALFKEGREHIESGDFAIACPKFAASFKLDPTSSTLLNLADCHQRAGQTATAYDRFVDAAALAKKIGRADREKTAKDRLEALEPRLTKVELKIKEKGELTVTRDGAPMTKEDLASPVRVDPGPHTFFVAAPGKKSFSSTVSATEEGKTYTIEVPELPSENDDTPVVARSGGDKSKPPPEESPGSSRKTVAYIVGGAGLVIAGVGGYFGLRTMSKWSDSQARCTDKGCDREGVDLASDAKTSGFISTIGIAAGGALLATGVILFLTAPSKSESAKKAYFLPSAGPSGIGVTMGGAF